MKAYSQRLLQYALMQRYRNKVTKRTRKEVVSCACGGAHVADSGNDKT
jgi:hypothetical protein